jgi:hypothetical protein
MIRNMGMSFAFLKYENGRAGQLVLVSPGLILPTGKRGGRNNPARYLTTGSYKYRLSMAKQSMYLTWLNEGLDTRPQDCIDPEPLKYNDD